jgi:ER lumen protein retaining receptor
VQHWRGLLALATACQSGSDTIPVLMCSFIMEYDVHTLLDLLTLTATGWIIFVMLTAAKSTWQADKDTLWEVYIVRASIQALQNSCDPHQQNPAVQRMLWLLPLPV